MADPIGWHIVRQEHKEEYMGNGEFTPVIRVYYMTDSGTTGSVAIPESRYNRDAVVNRLNELVGRIHEVAALGNDGL